MGNVSQIQELYSGEQFVKRIDTILEQMNLKRPNLCKATGISKQAITNWKTLNRMPNVDAAVAISTYLKVELEWLLTGQLSWDRDPETQPCKIYSRLYYLLKERTKAIEPISQHTLHEYVKDIVDDSTLTNWAENRCIPDPKTLYQLSVFLDTSFPFLLANITDDMSDQSSTKTKKISLEEYKDFSKYKNNMQFTRLFDELQPTDKDAIYKIINSLIKK